MSIRSKDGTGILGRLKTAEGRGVVIMKDRFDADEGTVWTALTDRDQLALWLGDFTGELRAGGVHHSRFHASGAEGDIRVDACEQPAHLRVTRLDEAGKDGHVIDITLRAEDGGTIVSLTQAGLPLRWIVAFGAGMQVHFEDLALHLAGKARCNSDARMDELMPLYEKAGVTSD